MGLMLFAAQSQLLGLAAAPSFASGRLRALSRTRPSRSAQPQQEILGRGRSIVGTIGRSQTPGQRIEFFRTLIIRRFVLSLHRMPHFHSRRSTKFSQSSYTALSATGRCATVITTTQPRRSLNSGAVGVYGQQCCYWAAIALAYLALAAANVFLALATALAFFAFFTAS